MSEEANPNLSNDLQEASSIRYGVELKIALLSSGRWAIWHGAEAETGAKCIGQVQIVDQITDAGLRGIAQVEALARLRWEEQYEARHRRLASGTVETIVAGQDAGDIGL